MNRTILVCLLGACHLLVAGAFVPAKCDTNRQASTASSAPPSTSHRPTPRRVLPPLAATATRSAFDRNDGASPLIRRRHQRGLSSELFSLTDDDATHPESPGESVLPSRVTALRTLVRRALLGWIPMVLRNRKGEDRSKTKSLEDSNRIAGRLGAKRFFARLVPSLMLALLIWHRSPSALTLMPGQHQPQHHQSNVAHATSSTSTVSSRTGSWMSRVIPRTSSSSSNANVVEAPPAAAAAAAAAASVSESSGGEARSTAAVSLSSVWVTTTAVATLGAGTTTVVLRRSKEARRFVEEKQGKLRQAFQSNLRRVVRHDHDPDDVDDNVIMANRFRFRRAREHDLVEGDEYEVDLNLDQGGSVRPENNDDDASAAAARSRASSQQVLRKKSEQDYIQDLLDRVKRNVAAPSMRRTERSVVERAAEVHPGTVDATSSSSSKPPSNGQSVVQSLKSISSLSTSTLEGNDVAESDVEPSTASSAAAAALDNEGHAALPISPATASRPFLHDVDAAYALAFDATSSATTDAAMYLHGVDEAFAQAFGEEPSIVSATVEASIPESNDAAAAPPAGVVQHEVDEAYAKAFGLVAASSGDGLSATSEQVDSEPVTVSSMSDLALIGGELSAAVLEDNVVDSDVMEASDVVEQYAAIDETTGAISTTLEASTGLEEAAPRDASEPMALADEDVMPTTVIPKVRVIESLESLVESPDAGVASAAADVLADVEIASDLADELKALRKSIDTTATSVDDEGEDATTNAPVEVSPSLASVPERDDAKAISLESSTSLEETAQQDAGEPVALMDEEAVVTPVTPNKEIKVIESLESLVESPDLGVASAAADVLADVEIASDLADELKALRKSIDTTATTVDDEGDYESTTNAPNDAAASLTSVPQHDAAKAISLETTMGLEETEQQDAGEPMALADEDEGVMPVMPNKQIKVIESLESLVESPNLGVASAAADVLADVEIASDLADELKALRRSIDTTATTVDDSVDAFPEVTPATISNPVTADSDVPAPPSLELETIAEGSDSEVTASVERATADDEFVGTATTSEVGAVLDESAPVTMIAGDVEASHTLAATQASRNSGEHESVGTFPAWIRDRVRSKRQHQKERSRAKKTWNAQEVGSAPTSEVQVATSVSSSAALDALPMNNVEVISPKSDAELIVPSSFLTSALTHKQKVNEDDHLESIPNPRSVAKKRREKKMHQLPQNPADAQALSRKYAAIPSLEERAFEILKDLGMLEPMDDSDN